MRQKASSKLIAVFLLAFCLNAPAQQQKEPEDHGIPRSEVQRKNLAPVSKDILKVNLPKATEATLSNGLTVLVMEDHKLPLVSVEFFISGAGPLYEPGDTPGLASITAQLMREGTRTRNSRQIAEEVELLGASVNASSGFGSSAATVSASGLSDNFDKWFALATDVLLNPSFPADELEKVKARLRIGLRQQRTSPGFLMSERFSHAVYDTHPAANVSTTLKVLDALTPEMLAKWHRDGYAPQTSILGIAGDVKAAEIVPKLETWLAAWKRTDMKEVLPPNPKPATARKVFLVERPDSVQTSLIMGNIGIDRRDPDYAALTVLNEVLGGGSNGRLFKNLREEKGYTYGAYSSFSATKYPGAWRAYADVRTDVTAGALTEFVSELQRIRDETVGQYELDDAKRSIVASFAISLEDPDELLNYAVIRKIYGFPENYWDTYPAAIMAVTPAEIQRVARKYINPETMQIIAVGDAMKVRPILEKYGAVERYDTEGKKLGN
jgi:predicted Zn-dependent peptidase